MKLVAPLVTLGVGALLAGGLLVANEVNRDRATAAAPAVATVPVSQAETPPPSATADTTTSPSSTPTTATATTTAATVEIVTEVVTETQAPALQATYKGPIDGTELSAALSITGSDAVAYVCDGDAVEYWLYGTVTGGNLSLVGADGSTITGSSTAELVGGIFATAGGQWTFSASTAPWPDWAPPITDGPGQA
jgi:serine/threonine-protein kinase